MSRTLEDFAPALESLQREVMYRNARRVRLPSWLREIGEECFAYSDITNFVVPAGVEVIGKRAFVFCSKLREVSFEEHAQLRDIGARAFF